MSQGQRRSVRGLAVQTNVSSLAGGRIMRPEERPVGLDAQCSLHSDRFVFTMGNLSFVMPWKRKMANGKYVCHPSNAASWELARRYLTAYRNQSFDNAENSVLSTTINKTYTALAVIDAFQKRGFAALSDVKRKDWNDFIKTLEFGLHPNRRERVSKRRLLEIFRVCDDLSKLYRIPAENGKFILNDGFSFEVFSNFNDAVALAEQLGKEFDGQTPDAPASVAFAHMNAAIEYVVDYAPDLIRLNRAAEAVKAQVREPTRARPGEKVADLLELLIGLNPKEVPGRAGMDGLSRSRIAQLVGMDTPTLYEPRFAKWIGRLEKVLLAEDSLEIEAFRRDAKLELDTIRAKPKKPTRNRDAAAQIGLPFSGATGVAHPWPITQIGQSPWTTGCSLEQAIANLVTSALIIILAFMGDRLGEGLNLDVDCIVEKLDGWYLRSRKFKSHYAEVGTFLEQPCPEVVVRAVRVMTELGAEARAAAGSKLFFMNQRTGPSVPDESTVRNRLQRFGKSTGASRNGDEGEWFVTPSQLRRFFATMWVNYFEFGGRFEALRRMLDHRSITTTLGYAKTWQKQVISDMQLALTFNVMRSAVFDGVEMKGAAGVRFAKLANRIKVMLLPEEEIAEWISARIDEYGFRLFPMPWGYCLWSKLAGKHAGCVEKTKRNVGTVRPETIKDCGTCAKCRQFVETPVFEPYWQFSYDMHERVSKQPLAQPRLKEAAVEGMRRAKAFIRSLVRAKNDG
ncbi:hypothetical protein GGE50_003855 [Rhizobium leguminosarum]|uniref:site-specific integrase n=1 Tax=Rhizobium leguminosarum TaxID=384 RepID=UPI00161BB48C|nr:site-specific integrase [Rhizobium leguminosarum]MBB4587951.1 hypothetical protein [Rhizobium leguminosarum]